MTSGSPRLLALIPRSKRVLQIDQISLHLIKEPGLNEAAELLCDQVEFDLSRPCQKPHHLLNLRLHLLDSVLAPEAKPADDALKVSCCGPESGSEVAVSSVRVGEGGDPGQVPARPFLHPACKQFKKGAQKRFLGRVAGLMGIAAGPTPDARRPTPDKGGSR